MAIFVRSCLLNKVPSLVVKPRTFYRPFGFLSLSGHGLLATTVAPDSFPLRSGLWSGTLQSPHRLASSSTNKTSSYGSGPNNKFSGFLMAIGISALVGGSLALRWYVNREPSYENLVTDAKNRLQQEAPTEATTVVPPPAVVDHTLASVSLSEKEKTELSKTADTPKSVSQSKSSSNEVTDEQEADREVIPAETVTETFETDLPPLQYINPENAGFPIKVRYLIVGAGTAGLACARSIRAADPQSRVLMVAGGTGPSDYAEPGLPETDNVEPPPYLRPPLSKELWRRNKEREARLLQTTGDIRRHSWLYYEAESFFLKPEELNTVEYGGVSLLRGDPVVRLDPDKHMATLASGRQITYERCLLATGGRPKRLRELERCSRTGEDLTQTGHVSYFRTLADYRHLRDLCDRLKKSHGTVAIIGGGFLGSELAVSLLNEPDQPHLGAVNHSDASSSSPFKVMHVFRESAPLGQILPPCLAAATGRYEASCGTELWPSSELVSVCTVPSAPLTPVPEREMGKRAFAKPWRTVTASHNAPERIRLRIRRNEPGRELVEEVDVDHVVFAVGIEPNVDLATSAGLEIDPVHGGYLVNAELETRAGVYAAGDAASYWDPVLGFRRRVEHLNFAEETGQLAGKNMAATFQPSGNGPSIQRYHYQSSLWSTLGPNLSWDAVGNVDAKYLLTRSFFFAENGTSDSDQPPNALHSIPDADLGRLGRGVVFYLTPKERRLVGVLLWNLPDDLYTDEKYAAPSRLNLARSLLAQRRLIGQNPAFNSEEAELRDLAAQFDLCGDLERDYADLKTYMESQLQQTQTDQSSTPDNVTHETTNEDANA